MMKYVFSLIASGIVISIAFMQCKNHASTKAHVASQQDTSILVTISESIFDSEVAPINKTEALSINNSKAIDRNKPKARTVDLHEKSKVGRLESTFIDKPEATIVERTEVSIIEKPEAIIVKKLKTSTGDVSDDTIVNRPSAKTPDKTTTLISVGFSLKSVKATVKGTSTLHDWESEVTIMEGKGSFQLRENVLATIKDGEVKIAVKGIISTKGREMDNKTYEAFRSDKYPYIIYSFRNAVVKINDSQVVSVETTGNLSMAGESKSVSLLANGTELPNGDLHLTVSKKIRMTDYNMKPPVMFLGTIKVGEEITVNFDFVLSKIIK